MISGEASAPQREKSPGPAQTPLESLAPHNARISAGADTRALLDRIGVGGPPDGMEQQWADELLARAAWSRITEPGDRVAGALIARLGAPGLLSHLVSGSSQSEIMADAWHTRAEAQESGLDPRSVRAGVERWRPRVSRSETLQDLERAAAAGLHLLVPGDPSWPSSLNDLGDHAPFALWLRGEAGALQAHGLAVVGARASSGYGENVTAEIVGGVCDAGATIVSGAAYGIDAVAHRSALAAGGTTVAVLAGGADRPYPAAHATLIDRIAEQGAVCSELIPSGAPTRWRFLHRKLNNKCTEGEANASSDISTSITTTPGRHRPAERTMHSSS